MIDRLTDRELKQEKEHLESFAKQLYDLEKRTRDYKLDSSYVQQKWKVVRDRKYLSPVIREALQRREMLQKVIALSQSKIETEEIWRKIDESSQRQENQNKSRCRRNARSRIPHEKLK